MKKVTIVGIGMGNADTITILGKKTIENADVLIGASRILDSFNDFSGKTYDLILSKDIFKVINDNNFENVVVVMSGDSGFFSGTTKLCKLLEQSNISFNVIPGISSMSYLASKLCISYEDCKVLSLHGRNIDPVAHVLSNYKTFILTDKNNTPAKIAKAICDVTDLDIQMHIGENLSYPEEKIITASANEVQNLEFSPLSVLFIINENYKNDITFGLDDELFEKTNSPMTKSEVRAICLSKLKLKQDDIAYDIGSGTGSVTVEMARIAKYGKVFALEKNPDGVAQTLSNAKRFLLSNIEVIEALAPDKIDMLPAPNAVFIGGSSGNLSEIIEAILKKNPKVRIVISAITLETISEGIDVLNKYNLKNTDICQISVAKSKKLGRYNMMMGQNPIYIISGEGSGDEV